MPFIEIATNLKPETFTESLLKKFAAEAAVALSKPPERINIAVHAGQLLYQALSSAPCVHVKVSAIAVVGSAEQNREHSARLTDFLSTELGLPKDRILLTFHPLESWQVGKMGTVMTFL
ncbi:D-dopachrome decarboxylase-B-like [Petromyzon marinus]|uniref:D-dopachrome decarboxylase n=1 Tax=Petromyzon marinus TaxID=7757 RepID=A0AAJ7TT07_PETMA|nr:D-dopachrome decarboxylase-B-like [Petromyzon marinus]